MVEELAAALRASYLDHEMEAYLLGRGGAPALIRDMGIGKWRPMPTPFPDADFCKKYGRFGERLTDAMVTPLYSPRGQLLGFEGRSIHQKKVTRFVLPAANWNPVWIGIREEMPKIWGGGTVWIVEGIFDLFAMRRVVPERDAVLSSLQARLTDNHIRFLTRFATSVNMVYDQDSAGRRATQKGLAKLQEKQIPCRDIPYSGGKDPGQIWEERGETVLRETFALYL